MNFLKNNISKDQVNSILDAIEERARQAYEQGHTNRGDDLYDAFDKLEIWLKKGMAGDFPVDLASLGLEDIELSEVELGEGQKSDEMFADIDAAFDEDDELDAISVSEPVRARQRSHYDDARRLSQLDNLRRQARAAESAGDSEKARKLWRQVVRLDPNDADAERNLQRYTAQKADRQVRQKIVELKQKMLSQRISDLDIALQLAREILSLPLDEKTQRDVQRWEAEVQEKRSNLKAKFGEIDTLAGMSRLTEAIAKLEELINSGAYEYADREGNIVSTSDQLRAYNAEYAAFCTQKSREYLERAEKSLPAYPKAAAEVIELALKEFDKADPATKDDLQRRLTEIRELIGRWEKAQERISQATKKRNPHERLALLEEAATLYPEVEGLDDLLAGAKRDAADAIVNDIRNIYDTARLHLSAGRLDEAHKEATKARNRASEMRGASEALDIELERIDELMDEIAKAAELNKLVAEIKKQAQSYINAKDFISAKDLIEGLDEAVRQHPGIKTLEGQITRSRGSDAILRLAQQRFDTGDYKGVLDLLDIDRMMAEGSDIDERTKADLLRDPRTEKLRKLAAARQDFLQGVDLVEKDPAAAKKLFEEAQMNDPQLSQQIAPYLKKIREWEARKEEVRKLLAKARELLKRNELEQAYEELRKARDIDSPLKEDALERWLVVRNKWKKVLLEELEHKAADSSRTNEIALTLHRQNLLDTREEKEHIYQVRLAYHRTRAQKAMRGRVKRWSEAIKELRAYLALEPDNLEIQNYLSEALRQNALAQAHKISTETSDGTQILDWLEEQLHEEPYLEANPEFIADMVRWAAQYNDFDRAEQYLDSLKFIAGENSDVTTTARQVIAEAQAWKDALDVSQVNAREDRYAAAVRSLDDVIDRYPNSSFLAQWKSERDKMQRRAVTALMEEARTKKRNASGRQLIDVISLYSQVIQLEGQGNNRDAEDGIRQVRGQLPGLVRSVADDAMRFNPDNRDTFEAEREAEDILSKLNDFKTITVFLGRDQNRLERSINQAAHKLSRQRDQLRRVNKLLDKVRDAINNPVSDRAIKKANENLKEAKRELSRAQGISELEDELKNIEADRSQIKEYLKKLKEAIHNEGAFDEDESDEENQSSFQQVIEAVRGIRQIDADDKYQLQSEQNVEVYYDFFDKRVSTLAEHDKLARERQDNYRSYMKWFKKCAPLHKNFTTVLEEVEKARRNGSLDEQIEALERALSVGDKAIHAFMQSPPDDPMSYLSEEIQEQIEEWMTETKRLINELKAELERVKDKRELRNMKYKELGNVLRNRPVAINQRTADKLLTDMRTLDPNWEPLKQREKQTQHWRTQKQSRIGRFFRR